MVFFSIHIFCLTMLFFYFAIFTLLANGCLAVENRVVNGETAAPHQFPYHVALYWKIKVPFVRPRLYCGGAIINENWVLTAAHCVPRFGELIVKAGKHDVDQEESSEQARAVVRTIVHNMYKPPIASVRLIAQHDLALLMVDQPFNFNDYVKPATIPNSDVTYEYGMLAGWGSIAASYIPDFPKQLHYNNHLPVVAQSACAIAINEVVFGIEFLSVDIDNSQTCTGPIGESFGACLLDGGSAFVKDDNTYEIIGIVSWSHFPCGISGVPTVYTRVAVYREWIKAVAESM